MCVLNVFFIVNSNNIVSMIEGNLVGYLRKFVKRFGVYWKFCYVKLNVEFNILNSVFF